MRTILNQTTNTTVRGAHGLVILIPSPLRGRHTKKKGKEEEEEIDKEKKKERGEPPKTTRSKSRNP